MNTDYLKGWDSEEQQLRSEFMDHLYKCSGRTNGLYTGLWAEFAHEAGRAIRNEWSKAIEFKIKDEHDKEQTVIHELTIPSRY